MIVVVSIGVVEMFFSQSSSVRRRRKMLWQLTAKLRPDENQFAPRTSRTNAIANEPRVSDFRLCWKKKMRRKTKPIFAHANLRLVDGRPVVQRLRRPSIGEETEGRRISIDDRTRSRDGQTCVDDDDQQQKRRPKRVETTTIESQVSIQTRSIFLE